MIPIPLIINLVLGVVVGLIVKKSLAKGPSNDTTESDGVGSDHSDDHRSTTRTTRSSRGKGDIIVNRKNKRRKTPSKGKNNVTKIHTNVEPVSNGGSVDDSGGVHDQQRSTDSSDSETERSVTDGKPESDPSKEKANENEPT